MKPRPARKPSPAVVAAATKAAARFKEAFALHQQGRVQEARALYRQVLDLWPRHALALHLLGVIALEGGDASQAAGLLRASLDVAPTDAAAWNSLGVALNMLKQHCEALAACDQALAQRPDLPEAHYNRGNALMGLKEQRAAIESYDRAIRIRPDYGKAYANRGLLLAELADLAGAVASFDKALAFGADAEFLPGSRLQARLRMCDWSGIDAEIARMLQDVAAGDAACRPLAMLAVTDALDLQRRCAQTFIASRKLSVDAAPGARTDGGRVRIGYFSMDFRDHAVSYLAAQLFELHDHARFETFAFSYGPDTQDATRRRLERGFDHFLDVRARSDAEIAALARSRGIDIAVDLAGLTGEARSGIFALRAAPVQVNYLGYPGTMGAPWMDYLVADETLVPASLSSKYTEKIAWLPCFQVNDRLRRISDRVFSRAELGLPPSGFVFCCFNRSYKILPAVFGAWMRILSAVPGSVLLLHTDNELAQGNLRREAQARGVDARRLVFAPPLPQAEYLSRYRVADLFLDTAPFNGGTTVSDALWAGLPVLTCPGEAYASRMGASLLRAANLPDLVAPDAQAYERMAVELALDPPRLGALRDRLDRDRLAVPLFDSTAFTRHLEAAYARMHERSAAGLPAASIRVG